MRADAAGRSLKDPRTKLYLGEKSGSGVSNFHQGDETAASHQG